MRVVDIRKKIEPEVGGIAIIGNQPGRRTASIANVGKKIVAKEMKRRKIRQQWRPQAWAEIVIEIICRNYGKESNPNPTCCGCRHG